MYECVDESGFLVHSVLIALTYSPYPHSSLSLGIILERGSIIQQEFIDPFHERCWNIVLSKKYPSLSLMELTVYEISGILLDYWQIFIKESQWCTIMMYNCTIM